MYLKSTFFFNLITLCVLTFVPQHIFATKPNPSGGNVLENACQQTPHKEVCKRVFETVPSAHEADMSALALMSLRIASTNASDMSEQAKTLFGDKNIVDPQLEDGIADCLEHYVDASEQLDGSIDALLSKAIKDVETWVKVAIGDADACDSAIKDKNSELVLKNKIFRQLCENALALAQFVAAHHLL